MWRVILILLAAFGGFWFAQVPAPKQSPKLSVHPEKEFPLTEHKSFVLVLYAHNQSLWCTRALQSIFEQEYDHYRVIFVDDASSDGTSEKAGQFILNNNQDGKVILIRNETQLGKVASLYRAIDSCLDKEIILPLDAKDWLASPAVLNRLNLAYQNPDVWVTFSQAIQYPSYKIQPDVQTSYYSALFKQLQLQDLYREGHFAMNPQDYLSPLLDLAGGRVRKLPEPLSFDNTTSPSAPALAFAPVHYEPLAAFPSPRPSMAADILLFSFDRPLQLYACLESIQRYMTGFHNLSVLYRASDAHYYAGYEKVKNAFPTVQFIAQSMDDPKHDFKPNVQKILFDSPSPFILFGVDDIIVKDFVDLKYCMEQMEKTGAYGFYLRFGRHINYCYQAHEPQALPPSQPLGGGLYAWDLKTGEYDWGFANSLDMTLFRKSLLKEPLAKLKYKTPNSLEYTWTQQYAPKRAIGLYFEQSKLVNIPLNIVGKTGNPHMNYLTPEQLLAKFNQGLKIDIEPLHQVQNTSPHIDYLPQFTLR